MSLRALRDLQGGIELKIKAVFEQILDNLSSEHCTTVMHQTTKQQVVYSEVPNKEQGNML